MDQQLFKDIAEVHARLIDHRPVLQGHISYFLKEFEEKRGDREKQRLEKLSQEVSHMTETLIPESQEAMEVFLANLTAKLKVATEVCRKIQEKEDSVETSYLDEQRVKRKENWDKFMEGQLEKCDRIDVEINEKVEELKSHYADLEEKLRQSNTSAP